MHTTEVGSLESFYFEHKQQTLCGNEISPITAEFVQDFPSFVDRFFKRYYYIKPGADAAPYLVLFHSNRICLICLAPEHPALQEGIASINFDIGNMDRSKNAVKGKGKKGGMVLQADSTLALLCSDAGRTYKVPSCIRGKLIEVNVELAQEPQRVATAPEGEGYLAIVLPKLEHCQLIKDNLLTEEQYQEYLTKKKEAKEKAQDDIIQKTDTKNEETDVKKEESGKIPDAHLSQISGNDVTEEIET